MRKLTANTVQETTSTAGTGTITLALFAGYMRFSDRFSVGDLVYYSLRDGNNWEHGKGTVGAANTLARTLVYETLVAGVVTVSPTGVATPLTLSGSGVVARATIPEQLFDTVLKVENILTAVGINPVVDGCSYGVTAGSCAMVLNATPVVNDRIEFYQAFAGDGNGLAQCTIDPNGGKINTVAAVMTVDVPNFSFALVYVSAAYGWKVAR